MDCREINEQELAERYASRQLAADLRDQLEVHILDCKECLAKIEVLSAVRRSLTEQAGQIRLAVKHRAHRSFWVWTALAASFVIVFLVGFYQMQRGKGRSTGKSDYTPAASPSPAVAQIVPNQLPPVTSTATAVLSQRQRVSKGALHAIPGPAVAQRVPKELPPVTSTATAGPSQGHRVSEGVVNAIPIETGQKNDETALSIPAQPSPRPELSTSSQPRTSEGPPVAPAMSDETAAELYSLGYVQPFVEPMSYNFAGIARRGKRPGSEKDVATVTSGGVPLDSGRVLFQKGMNAYAEGSYGKASEILENARQAQPAATDINFYLGISRLLSGQPADSIAPLKTALTGPVSPLTQPAHFYLAKAYIQLKRLPEAEDEMQAAAVLPGRFRAEARPLVVRIEALRKKLNDPPKSQVSPPD